MDFSGKIRGARAILCWSREQMAERSGVSVGSLRNIEEGGNNPTDSTVRKILRTLTAAGIELSDTGITQPDSTFLHFKGEDFFNEVLEDVYFTLIDTSNAELLLENADDRLSPPETVGLYRKIRNLGVKMRQIVEAGNTYMMGPVAEYRWVPSEYYDNGYLKLVYGDKVYLDLGPTGVLIKNSTLANYSRKDFNLKWSFLPKPDAESTADVRF
jgi:transcriptional regulator with XRE-family HTH domain